MHEYLIRMTLARPFVPFTLLLEGGHVADVFHPEFVSIEKAAQFVTIYTPAGHRLYTDTDRIVAIRTIHAVDE